jgi:hypothetical protein
VCAKSCECAGAGGRRGTLCAAARVHQRDKDHGVLTGAAHRRARAAAGGPGPAALLHAAHAGHHRRQTHRQGELNDINYNKKQFCKILWCLTNYCYQELYLIRV